jgi:hypothetical protein
VVKRPGVSGATVVSVDGGGVSMTGVGVPEASSRGSEWGLGP